MKMILCIDYQTVLHIYSQHGKYVFDPDTYQICKSDSENIAANLILFPAVSRTEAQRAYIDSLNNRRLSQKYARLSDEECWEYFWKMYDNDSYLPDFERFENRYQLEKIIAWCDENNIAYYIDKKDSQIRWILE